MSGRRGNGEGAIYFEQARDRWVGQLDLSDGSGKRVRRKVTGRTKTAVAQRMRDLREETVQVRPSTGVVTVKDLLERWLATAAASKHGETSSTFVSYKHHIDAHLVPALGKIRLDHLRPEQVDAYLAAKAAEGYGRGTLVKHRSVFGLALRWGVRRRHLSWDPAALAELPSAEVFAVSERKQRRQPRSLTADETKQFVSEAVKRRNGILFVLALTTGLRPGELLALSWDDVDLEDGVVHVRRAWKGAKGNRRLGDPKTKGAMRSISLSPAVVDQLKGQFRQASEDRRAARSWADPDHDLVFATRTGEPLEPGNLRRLCQEIADEAEVGHVTPYDCRHTATSLLSAAGVRNEELADLLGHVDTRMVERHYRHRLGAAVEVAAGPMSQLLGEQGADPS